MTVSKRIMITFHYPEDSEKHEQFKKRRDYEKWLLVNDGWSSATYSRESVCEFSYVDCENSSMIRINNSKGNN